MKKTAKMPAGMPMKAGKGYPMKPKGKGGKKAC
jgi:hypothetical protein